MMAGKDGLIVSRDGDVEQDDVSRKKDTSIHCRTEYLKAQLAANMSR